MENKIDHRGKGGLNNKGYPLRKIVQKKDGLHHLECGHILRPVSGASIRSRRCPECVGEKLDQLEPVEKFVQNITDKKKVTSFETGEIKIERELPGGGYLKFSIQNIEISYEEVNE